MSKREDTASKLAELRMLKLEATKLNELSFMVKEQLNRLKIEELTLKNIRYQKELENIQDQNVENVIVPATTTQTSHDPDSINKTNLDLAILPHSPRPTDLRCLNDESYSEEEDDEDNECLLKL